MPYNLKPIVSVRNLKKYFPITKGFFKKHVNDVKAVDDISFDIFEGEAFGVVGESGCGKTTTGMCIIRAIEITAGEIKYFLNGKSVNISSLNKKDLKEIRKDMQLIFQDPYSSLNPRMVIRDIVGEPLVVNKLYSNKEREIYIGELLEKVGLQSDTDTMNKFPHAFSGGQRQRIGIARALALNPKFIVCDEPVSALDVSVQAQVLNLLNDLQEEFKLTYLFITHNLSVIRHMCDRVAVMYVGHIVEMADKDELFRSPRHPYTEALISSIPVPDPRYKTDKIVLKGEVADPSNPPSGCTFHPRCKYAKDICKVKVPAIRYSGTHHVACHMADKINLKGIKDL